MVDAVGWIRGDAATQSNAGAIIGGLAAGAMPGSVLGSQNGDNSGNCASRYRSYRASDNTCQPFNGPR